MDALELLRSVTLFIFLPFLLGWAVRTLLVRSRGREWTFGPFKQAMGEVKLWALVAVIIGIFASQSTLSLGDLGLVALIILVITLFFVSLFLIGVTVGRLANLGYEDTTTLVFTTTARNSESVLPVAAAAFPGHPLVIFAILIGPVVELPALLLLSRAMLWLKGHLWKPADTPAKA